MNIDDWKSQIKREHLDFFVSSVNEQGSDHLMDMKIVSTLEKYPILAAKENVTIYPTAQTA